MKILLSLIVMLFAASVSASYTSDCDALISKWKACGGDAGNCSSIEKDITEQCKCHVKKGGVWKLVHANIMGAGNSNVCGFVPEDYPPPHDDPPRLQDTEEPDPGKGGGDGGRAGDGRK